MRGFFRHFFIFWKDIDGNFSLLNTIVFILLVGLPGIYWIFRLLAWLLGKL